MKLSSTSVLRRRVLGVAAVAAAAVTLGACVPETPPATTTPVDPALIKTITNGTLDWTISQEANNGAFSGDVNFWNASATPATNQATYKATDGDITVLKKNAAGNYVAIGSESAVSWANKNRNGAGTVVSATNAAFLDQKVRFTGGDGTVNTQTGEATISWSGAFTINFYGVRVPFSLTNLKLTVNSAGKGTLTATASGVAKDIGDPDAPGTVLPARTVTLADLPNVYGSGSKTTGFTNAATAFIGNTVTVPAGNTVQTPKTTANQAYWGSWPQSFVDFQIATTLSSYWYSSGLSSVDPHKPQAPISVAFNLPA